MWTILLFLTFVSICAAGETGIIIHEVTLSTTPANVVVRGTRLALVCGARVSHTSGISPNFTFHFYKDFNRQVPVFTVTTKNRALGSYIIADTRAAHSGVYLCELLINSQRRESKTQEVYVEGLQTPVLHVDKQEVMEGEAVHAECRVQDEPGTLTFIIKNKLKTIFQQQTSDELKHTFTPDSVGGLSLSCSYSIYLNTGQMSSNNSNEVIVNVRELDIVPRITVRAPPELVEGDVVNITCEVPEGQQRFNDLALYLTKGDELLYSNMKNKVCSTTLTAPGSINYSCIAEMNNIYKTDFTLLNVTELFSAPELTITPTEVFEQETFRVSCRSSHFASKRIEPGDVKYSIYRDAHMIRESASYSEPARAATTDGEYKCVARARGIEKASRVLPFTAKVLVSKPVIEVRGRVILDQPFQIQCISERGSLPITYTLTRNDMVLQERVVREPRGKAQFSVRISSENETPDFRCQAQNNGDGSVQISEPLAAEVIVPVGKPILMLVPGPDDITENHDVTLLCITKRGTPPISFKWFRNDSRTPLGAVTVEANSHSLELHSVNSKDAGSYFCEALNGGRDKTTSDLVSFTVTMATWKKGLIAGGCLLPVTGIILGLLIFYFSKRGKRGATFELSVKPANPKTDAGSVISLE